MKAGNRTARAGSARPPVPHASAAVQRRVRIAAAFGLAIGSPDADRLIAAIDADVEAYRGMRIDHAAAQSAFPKRLALIKQRLAECDLLLADLAALDTLTVKVMRDHLRELSHYAASLYPNRAPKGRPIALVPRELVWKLLCTWERETGRKAGMSKRGPFARLVRAVLPRGVDPWPAIRAVVYFDKFLRGDPKLMDELREVGEGD